MKRDISPVQRLPSSPPTARPRRIVLAGFMGSGKTTVGRALAEKLRWRFADLDDAVSAREGASVPEIFARFGEAQFRQAEAEVLQQLLLGSEVVVALGGGAPETEAVRRILGEQPRCSVVYLEAPFDTLVERCSKQAREANTVKRPLFGDREALLARHTRRVPHYLSVAHLVVDANRSSPAQIADQVIAFLAL